MKHSKVDQTTMLQLRKRLDASAAVRDSERRGRLAQEREFHLKQQAQQQQQPAQFPKDHQPSYDRDHIHTWANDRLATELVRWATSREKVSKRRVEKGEQPLDTSLLVEAAARLRTMKDGSAVTQHVVDPNV